MKTVFVDTNVFLRFFTRDDKGQHERAAKLFLRAKEGKVSLITGPPVLFEMAWTLRSAYKQSNADILNFLDAIVAIPNMGFTDKDALSEAIVLAKKRNMDFADAYIAASAQRGANEVATFNTRHFRKLQVSLYHL